LTIPILQAKLYIPSPQTGIVPRPRLVERLNLGLERKLILVSAPAGFGKTTLLSKCIQVCNLQTTWISLDQRDNQPERFLTYFILALQKIEAGIGDGVLNAMQAVESIDMEVLLTSLINEIAEIVQPFVFVLDDYHNITAPDIQESLFFLLENQPPQMHLVISSRSDPPWPLARLRVRGEMLEIRTKDMRFMFEEAATFLNEVMGLGLSEADILALQKRIEGWAAGLQMAALSMRNRDDKVGFIQDFTGSHI
jgi:LuxR family maltose regulon positive regulatory protein